MRDEVLHSGDQRIRDDLAVEFIFDVAQNRFDALWTPQPPRKLSAAEIALYRQVRGKFMERVAAVVGGAVAVVEL